MAVSSGSTTVFDETRELRRVWSSVRWCVEALVGLRRIKPFPSRVGRVGGRLASMALIQNGQRSIALREVGVNLDAVCFLGRRSRANKDQPHTSGPQHKAGQSRGHACSTNSKRKG